MLKRFWFVTFPENRFGPRNFGVTAYTKDQAKKMLIEKMSDLSMDNMLGNLNDETEVIENIDIQLLDPNHIIPNIGVVTFEGVWYPNLCLKYHLHK